MFSVLFLILSSVVQQESVDSLVLMGLDAAYCEDYEEARGYIQKAIAIEPDNPLVYFAYTGILGYIPQIL